MCKNHELECLTTLVEKQKEEPGFVQEFVILPNYIIVYLQ